MRSAAVTNRGDTIVNKILLILGLLLFGVLALAVLLPLFRAFKRELRYVKMKALSSRTEKELEYWEKRKKDLWKSLLPFCHYNHHGH